MAAVDVINGSDLVVYMNGVKIGHSTNHSLSWKMKTRDTSDKDSGIYDTKDVGRFDISASCEGMMVYGHYNVLFNAMRNREPVYLKFGEELAGVFNTAKWYAHGWFVISDNTFAAPDQGNATFNTTFEHYSGFSFTPDYSLDVQIIGTDSVLHDGVTGCATVIVSGGVAPYTYAWTYGAGGSGPTTNGKAIAYGFKGTYEGITVSCAIQDSSPVATGTITTSGGATGVGIGTTFTDYTVGQTILVTGETARVIATITDDLHLTVTPNFSNSTTTTFSVPVLGTASVVISSPSS